jgi:hypothetical protein
MQETANRIVELESNPIKNLVDRMIVERAGIAATTLMVGIAPTYIEALALIGFVEYRISNQFLPGTLLGRLLTSSSSWA